MTTESPQPSSSQAQKPSSAPAKQENVWVNLIVNIAIPTFILIKLSNEKYLGTELGVVIALMFPLGYGLYDYITTRKINIFSGFGILNVMLTGGITLLKLPVEYMAIKEAAIPTLLGIIVLGSTKTKYPLVKVFIYSNMIFDKDRIEAELIKHNTVQQFERVMFTTTLIFAASFFLSAGLNFGLAKYILVSPPGSEAFNVELGKMTALSYPVIAVPSLIVTFGAIYYLFKQITQLTSLSFEDMLLHAEHAKNGPSEDDTAHSEATNEVDASTDSTGASVTQTPKNSP